MGVNMRLTDWRCRDCRERESCGVFRGGVKRSSKNGEMSDPQLLFLWAAECGLVCIEEGRPRTVCVAGGHGEEDFEARHRFLVSG